MRLTFDCTCNAIVVDRCVVLGGVLVDVHLVHLGGVGQLGELVLWNVGEALGLQGMQVGDVLTWGCKCISIIWKDILNISTPGRPCIGLGQMFL